MFQVWNYFIALNSKRTSNGFGLNPISYTEIRSYFELHEIVPLPFELEAIDRLDRVALDAFGKQQEQESKKKNKK